MSVENPESAQANETEIKQINGEQRLNGVSNGHSKSDQHRSSHKSSKDKYRDKDRDRDRDREKGKDSKSSKSNSSSHRDKEKDKNATSTTTNTTSSSNNISKDKEKDKDRHYSSSHKSSNRDKDKDKDRSKDKDRERDRDRDKNKHRSRDDRDKDKSKDHKSSTRDKDKEKDKDSKESRDKDKKSSSSSNHHRDREHDKDKLKKDQKNSSSTTSTTKDKHSSSSSSRHRDKDKDRHTSSTKNSSSSNRDKHRSEKDHRDSNKNDQSNKSSSTATNSNNTEVINKKENEKEILTNNNNNSSSEINIKLENNANEHFNHFNNTVPVVALGSNDELNRKVKNEFLNASQASSCDYSMSQFRDDESAFEIKGEYANGEDEDEERGFKTNFPIKQNEEDVDVDIDEELPLAKRKMNYFSDEDDDKPLTARKKVKTEKKEKTKKKKRIEESYDEDDYEEEEKPKKKIKTEKTKIKQESHPVKTEFVSPQTKGRKKKDEDPQEVWKWWEEEKRDDGVKWKFLEHKGPVFAPDYVPLPDNVKFMYDGKVIRLTENTEEVASFYAKMLEHDYTSKKIFNDNFFKDWRKFMTSKEKELITNLDKCNFKQMHAYFQDLSEKNKSRTKDQKLALKNENEQLIQEYGFCTIDGHREKIGNFKIEPPGLFRGRGEHPKMGMIKRRVTPEDILINCSKDSKIPVPPKGCKWKEVRHDNTVTWLASWTENVQGQVKYIMLNPSSKLKGEKDWQKYETARRLQKTIVKIRSTYRDEWKSKEMRIRQRAVALYFIDKLALRAGNEKDEDQADTVGCCSLRVEHIELHKELNGKDYVVVFDFLGKDSIRYYNEVEVEKRVFKNLELFKEGKKEGDDLFDRLNTVVLNEHLRELMEGLTAKVFRTYNASSTLQTQLDELTDPDTSIPEKLLSYNRANRAVAILCNHQRAVPKSHSKSMANLKEKIQTKRQQIKEGETELKELNKAAKRGSVKEKLNADKKKKALEKLREQLAKLEIQETDRDENKTIALGTSKLNYLDPRISVAWCKKFGVPIEKIFNKTQRDKFRWAIDMAGAEYRF